jgi:hypothetical protein
MNGAIKDATARRYYYDSHGRLRQHLADVVSACNFTRRLKTLKGLAPYELICNTWLKETTKSKFGRSINAAIMSLHLVPAIKRV